jgi:hypothetical protein
LGSFWALGIVNSGGFPAAGTRGMDGSNEVFEWDGTKMDPWFHAPQADFNARHWIAQNVQAVDQSDRSKTYAVVDGREYLRLINNSYSEAIVTEVCETYLKAEQPGGAGKVPDGGYIYHFDYVSNRNFVTFNNDDGSLGWHAALIGGAAPALRAGHSGCFNVYQCNPSEFWLQPPPGSPPGKTGNTMEEIYAHEVGHAMFLAHATDGETAAYTDIANKVATPNFHDPADETDCNMSYKRTAPRHFCGGCLLRLSGWKK